MASGSKSSTSNTSQQTTNTRNLNLQDIEGTTLVAEGGGITYNAIDGGVVEASRQIAGDAIDVIGNTTRAGFETIGDLGDAVRRVFERASDSSDASVRSAFDLSDRTLDYSRDTIQYGTELAQNVVTEGLKFSQQQSGAFTDAVGALAKQTQDTIGQTVTGLNAIAKSQATSSDERVAQIAKVAIIGAVVIGAALMFKRAA